MAEQTLTPIPPIETAPEISPPMVDPAVSLAVENLRNRDTLDAYGHRLRGTIGVIPRTLGLSAAAGAVEFLSTTTDFGPQTYALGGGSILVGGGILTGVGYLGSRLRARSTSKGAEAHEAVVRDAIREPVDIMRVAKGKQKGNLIARWYGADAEYQSEGVTESSLHARFGKVVATAAAHGIEEIVVSRNLTKERTQVVLPGTPTTTTALIEATKRIHIVDRESDPELVRMTTSEARALLKELKVEGLVSKTEALMEWLIELQPEHPIATSYAAWLKNGKDREGAEHLSMQQNIRSALYKRFSSEENFDPIRSHGRKTPTDTTVSIGADTVTFLQQPRWQADGIEKQTDIKRVQYVDFVKEDTMEEFIANLLMRREEDSSSLKIQEDVGSEDYPEELERQLELALHYLLIYDDGEPYAQQKADKGDLASTFIEHRTLFSRIRDEHPRTAFLHIGVRHRGSVKKKDQTVEYKITPKRAALVLGSMVLTAAAVGGLGWGAATAAEHGSVQNLSCNPTKVSENLEQKKLTPAEQAACDAWGHRIEDWLDSGQNAAWKANNSWENTTLTKAAHLGVPPSLIQAIFPYVNQQWAQEKAQELAATKNLYSNSSGDGSGVGDVKLVANLPVWQLDPSSGASTEGYWPTNIYTDVVLRNDTPGSIAPYSGLSLEMDIPQTATRTITTGEIYSPGNEDTPQVDRSVPITSVPPKTQQPLIKVSGEQPLGSGRPVDVPIAGLDGTLSSYAIPLPVIEGGDIVAASVAEKTLSTDETVRQLRANVEQNPDGTYALIIPEQDEDTVGNENSLDLSITYWVEPNAKGEIPLHALTPMTTQQVGQSQEPLSQVVTPQERTELLAKLHLPPTATAQQVADTLETSRTYSFTPYADNPQVKVTTPIPPAGEMPPTNTMLTAVASSAEDLTSLNCNVDEMITLIDSGGQNGDGSFADTIIGFHDTDGSKVLTMKDSHAWAITNTGDAATNVGNNIDGTPASTQPDKLAQAGGGHSAGTTQGAELITAVAAAGAASLFGRRKIKRTGSAIRNSISEKRLNRDAGTLGLLNQIAFASGASIIDADQAVSTNLGRSAHVLAQNLRAHTSRERLTGAIDRRLKDGTLQNASRQTIRKLQRTATRNTR